MNPISKRPSESDEGTDLAVHLNYSLEQIVKALELKWVSLTLLFGSVAATLYSLLFLSGGSFLETSDLFQDIDLQKIALTSNGISPYGDMPHFALYPPLYFYVWSVPYKLLVFAYQNPSDPGVFFGIRVLSCLLIGLCAFLVYRNMISQKFSCYLSISCASIFLACSLTALLILVGDSFGLFFLAIGCLMFTLKKDIVGVGFISLAVAFKVHPLLGSLVLLASFLSISKSKFVRAAIVFSGVMTVFVIVPVLEIPGAWNTFVFLHATDVQTYTFNVFGGSMDFLIDIMPSSSSGLIKILVNYAWVFVILSGTLALCYYVFKSKALRGIKPIDLLALGGLAWLILLKQTLPHYFLWALIPLLSAGRIKSTLYLIGAEIGGFAFFGLGHAFSTNFFSLPIDYSNVPNSWAAISFLSGGIVFVIFDLLAIRQLLADVKKEGGEKLQISGVFGSGMSSTKIQT